MPRFARNDNSKDRSDHPIWNGVLHPSTIHNTETSLASGGVARLRQRGVAFARMAHQWRESGKVLSPGSSLNYNRRVCTAWAETSDVNRNWAYGGGESSRISQIGRADV